MFYKYQGIWIVVWFEFTINLETVTLLSSFAILATSVVFWWSTAYSPAGQASPFSSYFGYFIGHWTHALAVPVSVELDPKAQIKRASEESELKP